VAEIDRVGTERAVEAAVELEMGTAADSETIRDDEGIVARTAVKFKSIG